MAIRKSTDTTFSLNHDRDTALGMCHSALQHGKFSKIKTNKTIYQISARYRTFAVVGSIEITLIPNNDGTIVNVKILANVDNIFALFSSPGKKIQTAFISNVK